MKAPLKSILINGIITKLNERLIIENKKLCSENLHSDQKPLHGGDMFFKLSFMEDAKINEIAASCGI